jgi:hypothetical protein
MHFDSHSLLFGSSSLQRIKKGVLDPATVNKASNYVTKMEQKTNVTNS